MFTIWTASCVINMYINNRPGIVFCVLVLRIFLHRDYFIFSLCGAVLYILFSSCQLVLFSYPAWGFSVLFPQLWGKCQGITRRDGARPTLFPVSSCVILCIFCICVVLCIVCVQMCTVLLPPGVNPIAVNKYIVSYPISYIISYHIIALPLHAWGF